LRGLNSTKDSQQVAAEELAHVFGGIAACHEGGGDFREVGCGVDLRGCCGDAIEVGAYADVLDAGDLDGVVEVIYERVEAGAADELSVFSVDLV